MTESFRYRLTEDDYAALISAFGLRRVFGPVPSWMWYAIGVANVVILMAMVALGVSSAGAQIMSITIAAIAFSAPALNRLVVRREFKSQGLGREDIVLTLEDTVIATDQGGAREEIGYQAITKVDERRDHILLWVNRRQAVIFPKRALGAMPAAAFVARVEQGRG